MSVILQGAYVVLSDGATVATDASLGEVFYLAGYRAARTMSNPTNPTTGQSVTYVIENTGGAVATSWGSTFKLAGTWTDPSPDRARSVGFSYNGTNWIETTRTGANLKLIASDPLDVATLVGWWEAEDLTLADAASVTSWPARYGPDLVAVSGNEPTFKTAIQNSRPVVRFDGTNDYLKVANPLFGATAFTLLAVFAKNEIASTNLRALADIAATGVQGAVFFENAASTANRVTGNYGDGGAVVSCVASSVGTAFHQWSWTLASGVTPKLYKDAGSAITGSTTASVVVATTNLVIGSHAGTQRYMNGDLAELLLYSTSLSDVDRASVATYLKNKWGTP